MNPRERLAHVSRSSGRVAGGDVWTISMSVVRGFGSEGIVVNVLLVDLDRDLPFH